MEPLVLHLPLKIRNRVRTESYFYINLNTYRNAPFHELSDMKNKFAEAVQDQIALLPQFDCMARKNFVNLNFCFFDLSLIIPFENFVKLFNGLVRNIKKTFMISSGFDPILQRVTT